MSTTEKRVAPFWRSASLEELAEQQGVSAVTDLDEISALWPVDDDPDEMMSFILRQRVGRGEVAGRGGAA